jgi:predicted dienelactone hydrolase
MRTLSLFTVCWVLCFTAVFAAEYDPLHIAKTEPGVHDVTVTDAKRTREIPLRMYLPDGKTPALVILFSHGLGGNRQGNAYLGKHWAARGYVVVFVQHLGSDDSVWKELPVLQRMAALKEAAGIEQFLARTQDIPQVLDQLLKWNQETNHVLQGRIQPDRIGMSGHSFGAVTTQAVSGQTFPLSKGFTDPRITAAVMMSPSSPKLGDANKAFGGVKIPWLLMTGTKDGSPIGDLSPADRLKVFPALPPPDKFELVLDKAEHSAFGERSLPGEKEKRNPNHHRAILAITTAFWDAYLRQDAAAKTWLTSDAVKQVLESHDHWQRK